MKRVAVGLMLVMVISLLFYGFTSMNKESNYYSKIETITVIPQDGEVPKRIELDQAWNEQIRSLFHFTTQGSRIIPYSWFTWLELADSMVLFRNAEHMESLRYLPEKSSRLNPSGLPIGFALAHDKQTGDAWVGLSCAACHTNQLDYKGKKILIEGAPTLANFVLFFSELVDALNATNKDDEKFERFSRRVLADNYSKNTSRELRSRLLKVAISAAERQVVNQLPENYPEDFTSYARLDAFGNIQNEGSAFALHDLNNKNAPTAPVSYPFVWGTHQSDVLEWNASAPNTPVVGPLVRNIGETVGVFGELDIAEASWWRRELEIKTSYSSVVDMPALGDLESWVKILRSPAWPEEHLPAIDAIKAAEGKLLYEKHCVGCHQLIARDQQGEKYIAAKIPVTEVGTDPLMAWNADYHMAKSLILEGTKTLILAGKKFTEQTAAMNIVVNGVVGIILKDPLVALKAGLKPMETSDKDKGLIDKDKTLEEYLMEHLAEREKIASAKAPLTGLKSLEMTEKNLQGLVYKARPLNGIWATAPYLHNGSVPNLRELLKQPEKRVKRFWVGSREFDPVNVGYVTNTGLTEFKVLDANNKIQPGNSNLGMDNGTDLTESQKENLLEFLKTL